MSLRILPARPAASAEAVPHCRHRRWGTAKHRRERSERGDSLALTVTPRSTLSVYSATNLGSSTDPTDKADGVCVPSPRRHFRAVQSLQGTPTPVKHQSSRPATVRPVNFNRIARALSLRSMISPISVPWSAFSTMSPTMRIDTRFPSANLT